MVSKSRVVCRVVICTVLVLFIAAVFVPLLHSDKVSSSAVINSLVAHPEGIRRLKSGFALACDRAYVGGMRRASNGKSYHTESLADDERIMVLFFEDEDIHSVRLIDHQARIEKWIVHNADALEHQLKASLE